MKIYVEIFKDFKNIDYFYTYYLDLLNKENNLEIKLFFLGDGNNIDLKYKNNLEQKKLQIFFYLDYKDLFLKITNLKTKNIFINTPYENLIILTNKIRKELGQEITKKPELFRNKKIQRELLLKYDKKITVNYLKEKLGNLDFNELKKDFGLPFILKPKDGVQSSGVAKIKKIEEFEEYKKNNNLENDILVEEFIDGNMFSVDYFVNEEGKIIFNNIVKVELAGKINIDDFFNLSRIISGKNNKEINYLNLSDFIKNTIEATGIKNTFVHHEFKLTSKGELKTIELNGRIGGYRLEIYKESYGINLLEMPFNEKDYLNEKIKDNFAIFAIYPEKKAILKSYNYELLEKIKKLKSFYSLRILPERYEGAEIGLTKDGFKKVGGIKLKNSNYEQFQKDYDFVEKNYKNLLILN